MEAKIGSYEAFAERFNPFPGLRPFEPDEDHLFFGRERETDELLRRLRTNRFVSVLGTSGSGKSSLVRSGLIPSLYSGFMVKAGSDWRVAIMRPGEDPIGNLAEALNHEDVLGGDRELAGAGRMLLESSLRRSALGLADCVRHARLNKHENLLVVVDQFEELFRFRESRKTLGSRDDAVAFAKLLLGAAQQTQVPVYIVITMRSDFIGDCMEYPGLPEAINRGQYLIPRMTREELRQAIVGPVAVGGGEIAPRLVTRLLNEVGDDPDQLPVLQHALMRTWDHWEEAREEGQPLDLTHYDSVGGMGDALSRHAEEALEELEGERARHIAERLFKALTDKRMDDRGVRHPTAVREVAAIADASEAEVIEVVEVFRRPGRSFLMPPQGVVLDGDSILDLSHESLMRHWTRLVEWVDEETISGKAYRRLCRSAQRHERGEAGLWAEPELSIGLKWRKENSPTAAWAARYDTSFDQAMRFLDQSREAETRRLGEIEAARRAKLRRARILAGVLGSAALVTLAFGLYALRAGHIARQAEEVATREAETSQAVTDFMIGLFGVADPEEARGDTITAHEILDEGARRIETELAGQPAVQARMLSTVGKIYGSLGLNDDARPLLEQAVETADVALGPDDLTALEARRNLAEVLWNQGRFDDAEALFGEVLERQRSSLGDEDPATLQTRTGLIRVYIDQGRFSEADEAAEQVLGAYRRALGDEHEATLEVQSLLGQSLAEQARFAEAEETLLGALDAQRRTLGEDHSDTVATMGHLGTLYIEAGRFNEAEKLYQAAVDNRVRIFGEEHPKTLLARYQRAELDEERGRWNEAEAEYRSVLDARRRVLGEEHPSTLKSEARLAWLLHLQLRLEEAEQLALHAVEASSRAVGEDDVQTREHANVLSSIYSEQGRTGEAEEILTRNLEIYTEKYGPAHPATYTARNNLGVSYGNWGRNDKQEELFRQNVEICREKLGPDHAQTLFFMNNLIAALDGQQRYEEGEQVALDTLERHRRALGNDSPQTLTALRQVANHYRSRNMSEEAGKYGIERLETSRRVLGDDHPETLYALSWVGWHYANLNQHDRAIPMRQQYLEGCRRVFGEEHPSTIGAYGGLAWLHELNGEMDVANELRAQAVKIRRQMADRDNAGPHDKNNYADALIDARPPLRDADAAVRYAEEACRMTNYENRNYVTTLANAYFLQGRNDDAIAMQKKALAMVAQDDVRTRNRMEERLGEFEIAAGGIEAKRKVKMAEIARLKEAAEKPDASPRTRNDYAWTLLTAVPADLRDPKTALRVSEVVNEETGFEDTSQLTTLAMAYHRNGQRQKAVETQEKALRLIPENLFFPRTNNENRLRIYRGDGNGELDPESVLTGAWSAQVGPVHLRLGFRRDGDYLVGEVLSDLPFIPKGEQWGRWKAGTREFEMQVADDGWTNPRWEPGDYMLTDDGALLAWHREQWFVVQFRKE